MLHSLMPEQINSEVGYNRALWQLQMTANKSTVQSTGFDAQLVARVCRSLGNAHCQGARVSLISQAAHQHTLRRCARQYISAHSSMWSKQRSKPTAMQRPLGAPTPKPSSTWKASRACSLLPQ